MDKYKRLLLVLLNDVLKKQFLAKTTRSFAFRSMFQLYNKEYLHVYESNKYWISSKFMVCSVIGVYKNDTGNNESVINNLAFRIIIDKTKCQCTFVNRIYSHCLLSSYLQLFLHTCISNAHVFSLFVL